MKRGTTRAMDTQDLVKFTQEPGELKGRTRETKMTRGTKKTKKITRNKGFKNIL